MSEEFFSGDAHRPRPAPSAGMEPWIEQDGQPTQEQERWTPEGDSLGAFDDSGRHTVPTDQSAAEAPTTSYGTFLTDPPYVVEQDPSAVAANADTSDVLMAVGSRAGSVGSMSNQVQPTPLTGELWQPLDSGPREPVTCPECGSVQDVHLNRRDAVDFCRRCDFPLFWAPSRVTRERDLGPQSEALRRLPGTVGRNTLASVACPHCAELNPVSAQNCIRCGLSMRLAPPPPPPPPPVVVAPPPPVVVEPPRGVPWWVWLLLALGAAAIVVLVVLKATGVF